MTIVISFGMMKLVLNLFCVPRNIISTLWQLLFCVLKSLVFQNHQIDSLMVQWSVAGLGSIPDAKEGHMPHSAKLQRASCCGSKTHKKYKFAKPRAKIAKSAAVSRKQENYRTLTHTAAENPEAAEKERIRPKWQYLLERSILYY